LYLICFNQKAYRRGEHIGGAWMGRTCMKGLIEIKESPKCKSV